MKKDLYSFDRENLHKVLMESWQQAERAWSRIEISGIDKSKIDNIIITGLGGSAISGDVLRNFIGNEFQKPITVNRTYHLPAYAGRNTLVIASSYSGNTEETVSVLKAAIQRGCSVVVLTTGGQVELLAAENNIDTVRLQPGLQPRYALYNSFFTLLRVVQDLGFIEPQDTVVSAIIQSLKDFAGEWGTENGEAYKTAESLKGFIPVIYSVTDLNDSAGRRFKGQLNENSKVHAWMAEYPEMNHNEIIGWETAASSGLRYKVVTMWDDEISPRIKKRMGIIKNLLDGEKIDILTVQGRGTSFKERLLESIYFCDWVSYYLALLNDKDPGEITFIHKLKDKMAED